MRSLFLALMAMVVFIVPAFGQEPSLRLSGKVGDSVQNPPDVATVALFRAKDSLLLRSAFTELDGSFIFEKIPEGRYYLKYTSMGYADYVSPVVNLDSTAPSQVLAPVVLVPVSKSLAEVAIVAKKQWVERKIDRTVVNVDALVSNAGTTALDVLEKSPGVMVQNGSINLKGKAGVLILIDDKPTYLSGTELENYLRALPSDLLAQIEIMTQPPAKYDAAGNAGVINIKTKKSKAAGFNASANLAIGQGQLTSTNNSLNFNLRKNKLNLFGNFSGGVRQSFSDLDIYRTYKNADGTAKADFNQNSYTKRLSKLLRGKVGLDYYYSEKTTFGIALNATTFNGSSSEKISSDQVNNTGLSDYKVAGLNKGSDRNKDAWLNLNYRHQFREGKEITFDADYLVYDNYSDNSFDNTFLYPDNTKTQDLLTGKLPSRIHIYTGKADYTHTLKNNWRLDAGVKTSYIKTDNLADYAITANNVTAPDYDKSNHFIYKENINAGYLNLSREMDKLSVQAGLRLEHTLSDGHQLGNVMKSDSSFSRSYASLFPTVYLSYKFDTLGNNQVGLNYGRRIDRPYYEDLNPFIAPKDKFTYYVGNPFLRPAFTHSVELFYTYKNKITTTLSYSNSNDNVDETIEILNGIYYSRPGNIGKKVTTSISVDAGFDLAKWLNFHMYTEVTQIHSMSNFYTGYLDTKGSFLFVNPNFQITLGKDWTAELSGRYISKVYNAQFVSGAYWVANAGIQKRFSNAATLKLSVRDLFYTQVNSGTIYNLALTDASWNNLGDTRVATLTFSYRFGKSLENNRSHEANGAQSEQNRIK